MLGIECLEGGVTLALSAIAKEAPDLPDLAWSDPFVITVAILAGLLCLWIAASFLQFIYRRFLSKPPAKLPEARHPLADMLLDRDWNQELRVRLDPPSISKEEVAVLGGGPVEPLRDRLQEAMRSFSERQDLIGGLWSEILAQKDEEARLRKAAHLIESMTDDIDEYVTMLSSLDGREVGTILVMATHFRNEQAGLGIDLSDPATAGIISPGLALSYAQQVRDYRLNGQYIWVNGPLIWLYSIVSLQNPRKRWAGRHLWKELQRGVPYVEEAAISLEVLIETRFDLRDADMVPKGLAPQPE